MKKPISHLKYFFAINRKLQKKKTNSSLLSHNTYAHFTHHTINPLVNITKIKINN